MIQHFKHKKQGYAVAIALILLVIGTGALIMLNRESGFFSRFAGFLSRSKKIHAVAENGLGLAKGDLYSLTISSNQVDTSESNTFATLLNGGQEAAINQGLYFDRNNTRVLTPRFTRDEGDYVMSVYYFAEDPCLDSACADNNEYNRKLPKRFLIVSEASNPSTGETFTIESRIQIKQENFAEISFGVLGHGDYPYNPTEFKFAPSVYGRSHFDLPVDKTYFTFDQGDFTRRDQQHIFMDLATFQGKGSDEGQDYPFTRMEWNHGFKTTLNFKKGYEEGVKLYNKPGEDDYNPLYDPSSDEYFDVLEAKSNSQGINLNNAAWLPSCDPVTHRIDVCLKFKGDRIFKYDCNYIDSSTKIMGRVDENIHPQLDPDEDLNGHSTSSHWGLFDSTASGLNSFSRFNGHPTDPNQNSAANWPDRYVGERNEVYRGIASGVDIGPANGVIYCNPSNCNCNVEIKGVIDGQVTVAAKQITIGGDIQYQDQDRLTSTDMVGLVAKEDIVIPPGIPQAATSAAERYYWQDPRRAQAADNAIPIGTGSATPHLPTTLAESYLGITNFVPFDGSSYVDRDFGDLDYKNYANWIPEYTLDTDDNTRKYYNSPMVLDLDAVMVSKRFVVDGIFNPGMSGDPSHGIGIITCENPDPSATSGVGCSSYKYRDPMNKTGSGDALYNSDGTLVNSSTPGKTVLPLIHVDGFDPVNVSVGCYGACTPFSCEGNNGDQCTPEMITQVNNYRNNGFALGEEIPRVSNHLLKIFGGVSSQFFLIHQKLGLQYGLKYVTGFRRKLIEGDPRSNFMTPPGFPPTMRLKIDELYQKTHMGKSPLVTN